MTTELTWRVLLAQAAERVDPSDARRIIEQAAGRGRADLVLHLDDRVPARALPYVADLVERRAAGEPLQYVLGRWGFRTLDLMVDRRCLIPRPETEHVVEVALRELRRIQRERTSTGRTGDLLVADLGTGSGAIGLSVAVESPARVWMTDRSEEALAVARANLAGTGGMAATRVSLTHGSWFDALPSDLKGQFDLIVSNPPYVAEQEVPDLDPEVARWEPRDALVPGPTGMEAIEEIVAGAPAWLARPGALVVELAPPQARAAAALAERVGFAQVDVRPDLLSRPRALLATL